MNDLSATSPRKPSGFQRDHVERLFARLCACYGAKFLDLWTGVDIEEVKAEWARQLNGMPLQAIANAIDRLGKFPPSLPEFRELCQAEADRMPQAPVSVPTPPPTLPSNAFRLLSLEERRAKIAELKAKVTPANAARAGSFTSAATAALSGISGACLSPSDAPGFNASPKATEPAPSSSGGR